MFGFGAKSTVVVTKELFRRSWKTNLFLMAEEDDQRSREIQREYLDFLDDDVSV